MKKTKTKLIRFDDETIEDAQWLMDNGFNLSKLIRDFIIEKSRKMRAYQEAESK